VQREEGTQEWMGQGVNKEHTDPVWLLWFWVEEEVVEVEEVVVQ
jgi:hypothetical protein